MKFNRILSIATVLCAVLSASCTKSEQPTAMSLDQSSVSLYVGQTVTVSHYFTPEEVKSAAAWSSSDEEVAEVQGGYIKGIKAGTATVTAWGKGFNTSCSVTVSNVVASKFTLNKTALTLYPDEKGEVLTTTIEPYNVTFPEVTWTSSDPTVATVDEKGDVEPVSLGNAVITASLVDGSKATCQVSVKVRVATEVETVSLWKSDKAGFRALLGAAADEGKTVDGWLTYSENAARWTANTTGKPRTATMTLSTGSSITVTQLEGADFKGDYIFNAKFFSNNKTWGSAIGNGKKAVTFGEPVLGETLTDLDGKTYTNMIGISGLYFEAVMDATVVIDYEAKTAKLGLFLDARDNAQEVKNGVNGYNYAAFLPELGTGTGTSWGAPYAFVQPELGTDQDYCWLWMTFGEDLTKASWNSFSEGQFMTSNKATSANRIIGITCAVSKSNKVDDANVSGTYNVIFQGNVNSSATIPMSFTRN